MKTPSREYLPLIIDIESFLLEKGIKFKPNSTGELIMDDCYNCHRAKKLYVSKEKGTFICFKCNEAGGPAKLISKYLDIPFREAKKICHGSEGGIIKSSIQNVKDEEETDEMPLLSLGGLKKSGVVSELKMPEPLVLPPEFKLLTEANHPQAWNYLKGRGYLEEELPMLKLMILPYKTFGDMWKAVSERIKKEQPELTKNDADTKELFKKEVMKVGRYFERVIFPVYIEGQVMGLVARDITGQKQPKVLNSEGNFRTFSVWNFDNAKYSEDLIVCEGNSSANKAGLTESIALLGKKATPPQIQLLKKTKAKRLYTCLDVGTDKEQIEICKAMMLRFPGEVYRIILPPHIGYGKFKEEITSDLVAKISKDHGVQIELFDGYFRILPAAKEKLKKIYLNVDFEQRFQEKAELMEYLIRDSEYLDAGDYSREEMAAFKKAAQKFSGGIEID